MYSSYSLFLTKTTFTLFWTKPNIPIWFADVRNQNLAVRQYLHLTFLSVSVIYLLFSLVYKHKSKIFHFVLCFINRPTWIILTDFCSSWCPESSQHCYINHFVTDTLSCRRLCQIYSQSKTQFDIFAWRLWKKDNW